MKFKQYESYPGKNRLQQKEKLNDVTYHSVIHKSLKRILKLTVGLRRQGILTDPSIDLITRKSSANNESNDQTVIHGRFTTVKKLNQDRSRMYWPKEFCH